MPVSPSPGLIAGATNVTWANLIAGEAGIAYIVPGATAAFASMQVTGTVGGATVNLQKSNTGGASAGDWVNVEDDDGNAIAISTAGQMAEFGTAATYLRPLVTGGTGASVTVTLSLRG